MHFCFFVCFSENKIFLKQKKFSFPISPQWKKYLEKYLENFFLFFITLFSHKLEKRRVTSTEKVVVRRSSLPPTFSKEYRKKEKNCWPKKNTWNLSIKYFEYENYGYFKNWKFFCKFVLSFFVSFNDLLLDSNCFCTKKI